MSLKVIHHPEAKRELEEAGRYYDAQSPGLADDLFDEVDAFVDKILDFHLPQHDAFRGLRRLPSHSAGSSGWPPAPFRLREEPESIFGRQPGWLMVPPAWYSMSLLTG